MRSTQGKKRSGLAFGMCAMLFATPMSVDAKTDPAIWIVIRGTPAELKTWPKGRKLTDETKVCIQGNGMLVLASTDGKRHKTYQGPGCNRVLKDGHLMPPNNPAVIMGF